MSRGTHRIDKLLVQGTMMDRRRKLTPDQVREIADLRYAMPATKVAEMFGVSKSSILYIWNPEARASTNAPWWPGECASKPAIETRSGRSTTPWRPESCEGSAPWTCTEPVTES